MTAKVLSGKEVAGVLREKLRDRVVILQDKGITPKLDIVIVGDAAPSKAYIKGVQKACDAVGVIVSVNEFPEDTEESRLNKFLQQKSADPTVHGIIIMQPLPDKVDKHRLYDALFYKKDVDSFNPINTARVMADDKKVFPPCTPRAVMDVLDYYKIDLEGKHAVVIGRSMVVGRPLGIMLLQKHATVTYCHSRSLNLEDICSRAEIPVAAAGKPELVTASMVKDGAVVIDVGINFIDGKMIGDVKQEEVSRKAGMITPVPGGIGSVTSTVLVKHVVESAEESLREIGV